MRGVRLATMGAATGALVAGALGLADAGGASSDQSNCVWIGVGATGSTTSTVVIPPDGTTCPSLPPSDDSPCPNGVSDFSHNTTASTVAEVAVFYCVTLP